VAVLFRHQENLNLVLVREGEVKRAMYQLILMEGEMKAGLLRD